MSKKSKLNNRKTSRKPSKPSFKWCPETREKIWIANVTLSEIQKARKLGENPNAKKKQLVRIPSKITREQCYKNAASALECKESLMFPTFGGRPWKVFCRFSEPNNHQKSPLFRWFRGELELAVLPHFLEKVTEQTTVEQKGKAKREEDDEEEEYVPSTDLSERTESQLSRLAWNDMEHQIPNLNIKWLSPNHQYFYSRKAAGDHAKSLVEQQLLIDKIIFGYGARGQVLRPTKPSKADALKAGKLRFLRDGLWIVGQEESWQQKRAEELEDRRQQKEEEAKKRTPLVKQIVKPKTPYQLFVQTQRLQYKKARLHELGLNATGAAKFVLRDADRELGIIWKRMTEEEKRIWSDLLEGKVMTEKETQVWRDRVNGNPTRDITTRPECSDSIPNISTQLNQNNKVEMKPNIRQSITFGPHLEQVQSESMAKGFEMYFREMASNPTSDVIERENNVTIAKKSDVDIRVKCLKAWESLDLTSKQLWETKANSKRNETTILDGDVTCQMKDEDDVQEIKLENSRQNTDDSNLSIRRSKRQRRCKRRLDEEMDSESKETSRPLRKPSRWVIPVTEEQKEDTDKNCLATDKQHDQESKNVIAGRKDQIVNQGRSLSADAATHTGVSEATPKNFNQKNGKNVFAQQEPKFQCINKDSPSIKKGTNIKKIVDATGKSKAMKGSGLRYSKPLIKPSLHWRLTEKQIQLCHDAAIEHFEKVMVTVKARALFTELADGFDLLRERGRGRYDMELPAFDRPEFSFLTDLKRTPWMDIVRQTLGDDVVLIHKGVFLSNPGAEAQAYHQDGPHLTEKYQRPCHAVNVFIPLVDLNRRNGPTEFVCGSHILGHDGYDREKVVTPEVLAGTPIIFDYRLGHRGLANISGNCRPVVYCTYATAANGKEFRDSVNFSRKRYHRLGELLSKPLSRDERLQLRKKALESRKCSRSESTSETSVANDKPDLVSETNTKATSGEDEGSFPAANIKKDAPMDCQKLALISGASKENNTALMQEQLHPLASNVTTTTTNEKLDYDQRQSTASGCLEN